MGDETIEYSAASSKLWTQLGKMLTCCNFVSDAGPQLKFLGHPSLIHES